MKLEICLKQYNSMRLECQDYVLEGIYRREIAIRSQELRGSVMEERVLKRAGTVSPVLRRGPVNIC